MTAGQRLFCRRRDSSEEKERAFLPFLRISTSRSKDTSARGSSAIRKLGTSREKSGSRRKCPLKCRRMRKIDDAEVLKADSSHALGTQARLRTAGNDKMIQVSGGGWALDQTSLEFLKRIERPAPSRDAGRNNTAAHLTASTFRQRWRTSRQGRSRRAAVPSHAQEVRQRKATD